MSDIISTIEKVVRMFRFERFSYLAISLISFMGLMFLIISSFMSKSEKSIAFYLGLFAPTGVITFSMSRILKMWSDVMILIKQHYNNGR